MKMSEEKRAALLLLLDDFQTFMQGGRSLYDWSALGEGWDG